MLDDRIVRFWMAGVAALVMVGSGMGCSDRAVGGGTDGGVNNSNDAGWLDDALVEPDTGTDDLVTDVLGWHSQAEEHSGFVPATDMDPTQLDNCNPWIMAADGGETWWTYGTSAETLLPLYPNPDHWVGVGLGLISGHLTEPGVYGHMGSYQRELTVTGWQLQVCPTVQQVRHCVVPRQGHFCQFPDPYHEARRNHLVRILPGPMGVGEHYELTIYYDEGVADGETQFQLAFQLPQIIDPGDTLWINIDAADFLALDIVEERLWFGHQIIPYPNVHDGWALRSTTSDLLRLSLSAESASGEPVHIWGDFPVNETIGYP